MAFENVFPNPTVKQVIFQIRFSNLFMIENKIGEFQLKIMEEFPEASLLYRNQILISNFIPGLKVKENEETNDPSKKLWQFKSPKDVTVTVASDSLDIVTNSHKTYNNPGSDYTFRSLIELVVRSFFEVIRIPIILRIGLRYIDECPIFAKTTTVFQESYNTSFNLLRFPIENSLTMEFTSIQQKGNFLIRYNEVLKPNENNNYILMLDFDGSAINVKSEEYLIVLDNIYKEISEEYKQTIKQPIVDYMNNK